MGRDPQPSTAPGLPLVGDGALHDTYDVIVFAGRAVNALGYALTHPRNLRPASISRHIAETDIHALPIVGLMAVMISVVIGYQGVAHVMKSRPSRIRIGSPESFPRATLRTFPCTAKRACSKRARHHADRAADAASTGLFRCGNPIGATEVELNRY